MRIAFFILFQLLFSRLPAQVPVFNLHPDSAATVRLPATAIRILRETGRQLSVADLQAPAYRQFFQPAEAWQKKRLYPGVYWLHYKLKNAGAAPLPLAFTSNANYASFYLQKQGHAWQKKQTGNLQAWRKKDGAKLSNSLPDTLQPGETVEVYQRNNYWQQIPSSLAVAIGLPAQTAGVQQKPEEATAAQINQLLSSLISGILLFAAIIYVRFYRIVQLQFYLYYSLFLFGFAVLYSPLQLLFQAFPLVNIYIGNFSFVLGLFFLTQFFRLYLRTPANYQRWDKVLLVVSLLPLAFFIMNYVFAGLFPPAVAYYSVLWGNRSFILVLDCLLATSVLYIVTHKSSAGILATVPALFLWGVGQTYKLVHSMLQGGAVRPPASGLVRCLNEYNYIVDLVSIVWIVSVFSSLLFRRFQHLQKRVLKEAVKNERLKRQKETERRELIARQKAELEQQVEERTKEIKRANRELIAALRNLKETQSQLVQSEKMASLGELTAGIAHEIQNPLNFITNFSEVSAELAEEIEDALQKNNKEEALAVAREIQESLQKITHHGRRADAIVKGMLQHSRASTGTKEPTNINALADEFLRLSFHGLRAKDKDFNARFITKFDESIGDIEVVPQDLGRVLLNLFNNAFYAVNEKRKQQDGSFDPLVSVSTKMLDGKVEIMVKDNGTGISPKALEKIYQPFFTTKPTGEGTGLGLSLSYEIITKGHNGEMKVDTKEGEYAAFTLILPLSTATTKTD